MMTALIKAASTRFPVSEVVLFRSLVALFVLVVWLGSAGEFPRALATAAAVRPYRALARGQRRHDREFLVLALLPLADATALTFVYAAARRAARRALARRNRETLSLGGGRR